MSTCVLTHVCVCTWFQVHRPCGTCRALPFHKRMEDLLCVRPEGLVKRCGGQLPPEGTRMTEDSHTVFLAGPALSRALALKARCHCLHLPVEAPEVHSPEKDSRAGGRLRPEAPMPVPDSRSWVPDATGPARNPYFQGKPGTGTSHPEPSPAPSFPPVGNCTFGCHSLSVLWEGTTPVSSSRDGGSSEPSQMGQCGTAPNWGPVTRCPHIHTHVRMYANIHKCAHTNTHVGTRTHAYPERQRKLPGASLLPRGSSLLF